MRGRTSSVTTASPRLQACGRTGARSMSRAAHPALSLVNSGRSVGRRPDNPLYAGIHRTLDLPPLSHGRRGGGGPRPRPHRARPPPCWSDVDSIRRRPPGAFSPRRSVTTHSPSPAMDAVCEQVLGHVARGSPDRGARRLRCRRRVLHRAAGSRAAPRRRRSGVAPSQQGRRRLTGSRSPPSSGSPPVAPASSSQRTAASPRLSRSRRRSPAESTWWSPITTGRPTGLPAVPDSCTPSCPGTRALTCAPREWP